MGLHYVFAFDKTDDATCKTKLICKSEIMIRNNMII